MSADSLLRRVSLGFDVIGYANDFVIISRGRFISTIYDRMSTALKTVKNWCKFTRLSVNPLKSNVVCILETGTFLELVNYICLARDLQ